MIRTPPSAVPPITWPETPAPPQGIALYDIWKKYFVDGPVHVLLIERNSRGFW
jgi:hypothetical protein